MTNEISITEFFEEKRKNQNKNRIKWDKNLFLEAAEIVHGNKYDYSKTDFKTRTTPVKIICPIHGMFEQIPTVHILKGAGCPKCSKKYHRSQTEFINDSIKIHGNKFDYSKVKFVNMKTKVLLKCNSCGFEFEQTPNMHINDKNGCPNCCSNKKLTQEEFINKARKIHGDNYSYEKVLYKNNNSKVLIKCNQCNTVFYQTPGNHLQGHGCPKCHASVGETLIEVFLKENNIKYFLQYKFMDCRDKNPLPFDFYLPDYNCCIEYQGQQHYSEKEYNKLTHNSDRDGGFEGLQRRDLLKKEYCKNKNMLLIEIFSKEEIIKKLGVLNS